MALPNKFTPTCPGCKKPMALVGGQAVRALDKSQHKDHFYICTCGTYEVKCFAGTLKPMGKPADATLREERRWCGVKIEKMAEGKAARDNITKEAALVAAWKWVSKIVGKEVGCVEDLNIPEMGDLVPELRKYG